MQVSTNSTSGITVVGTTLGRYELRKTLGRGAMGAVYEAWDPELQRVVALKVLTSFAGGVDDERFRREARAIAALTHPNIVTIYEFGRHGSVEFIVMQLLRGRTIAQDIERGAEHALAWKLRIAADICGALQHAHDAGIVHRDVKPANIHLGDDGVARLLDFGVAHLAGSALTLPCDILGTPAYLPPEMISGKTCDGRADLYSLAATVYEWITARRPHQAPDVKSLFWKILNEPAIPMSDAWPGCPTTLGACIDRGLSKNPDARAADAASFRAELLSIAAALPQDESQSPVDSTVTEKRRGRHGRAATVLSWAVAAVACAGITAWSIRSGTVAQPPAIVSGPAPPVSRPPAAHPTAAKPSGRDQRRGSAPLPAARREVPAADLSPSDTVTLPAPTKPVAEEPENDREPAALPIGTLVPVRILDELRTDLTRPGDSFAAALVEPLAFGGIVVAPAGSPVTGRVDAVGTAAAGSLPYLDVSLTALTIEDQPRPIRTGRYRIEPPEPAVRSRMLTLVVGAAVGAAAGGAAGGTKGAVIGGAAGAAIGAAASGSAPEPVYVLGDRLTFKLARALSIVPGR